MPSETELERQTRFADSLRDQLTQCRIERELTMEMLARLYEHVNDEPHELDSAFAGATCRACGMPWPCVVEEVRQYLPEHLR